MLATTYLSTQIILKHNVLPRFLSIVKNVFDDFFDFLTY